MKNIIRLIALGITFLVLFSCEEKTLDIQPMNGPTTSETNQYGPVITQCLIDFAQNEKITCKSGIGTNRFVGMGDQGGFRVISGLLDSKLWFKVLDVVNDAIKLEWISTESVSQPYNLYLGYGEYANVTFTEIWPYFYQETEKGALVTWYAYDGDVGTYHPTHQLIGREFKAGSTYKLVDLSSLVSGPYEATFGYDCAFCDDKCYTLEGDFLYDLSTYTSAFIHNLENYNYVFLNQEEALSYYLNEYLGLTFTKHGLKAGKDIWQRETPHENEKYMVSYRADWGVTTIDAKTIEVKGKFVLYDGTIYYRTAKLDVEAGEVLSYSTDAF